MADTKITALTALTAADPANDVIPIVDVSDTSMAASGTTKKISVNNILGASGTATLASATITGAATVGTTLGVTGNLTVDTDVLKVDTANNRVGIGTASPTAVLTVNGEISVTDNFALRLGSTQAGGATLLYNGSGNLDITPRSGFHTKLVDGNLIIGTSGKGIDFSATASGSGTMTSELLNDYEEGTWEGTITGSTTNPTIPVTATGQYTKIGRQVNVQIAFEFVSTVGASGNLGISGLPFVNSSVRAIGTAATISGATFTEMLITVISVTYSTIDFQSVISNASWANATHNAGTGRYFWANVTYTV